VDDSLPALPIVDHHCHSLLRRALSLRPEEFRGCFTEGRDPAVRRDHAPHSLFYQTALPELAQRIGCPPDEGSVLVRRGSFGLREYLALLFAGESVRGLLVDAGYPTEESLDLVELADLFGAVGCRIWPILRLEALAEELIVACLDFADLLDRYRHAIRSARARGFVGLKSIIAYRGGLAVAPTTAAIAAQSFAEVKRRGAAKVRLVEKPLLDYLLWVALGEAATGGLPVQIHCGIGDTDLDLVQVNPVLLRPIFEEPSLRDVRLILLHCYPYVDQAAYLASVYANVFVDLSLTVPFLGAGAVQAFESALALAPTTKVLYGSDGFSVPELHWLGARWGRRALAGALADWQAWGLSASRRDAAAERILHRNAVELYGLRL
jgi:predicted TIM-barrel fold metal-dependent hydrolase